MGSSEHAEGNSEGNGDLLRVQGLSTYFYTPEGIAKAVDDVSLEIKRGEAVALVGESGSGKSTVAFSIMQLLRHPGRIAGGRILLRDKDLTELNQDQMADVRGREISMIYQDPMTFLNPVMKVGDQVAEAVMLHQDLRKEEIRDRVIGLFKTVGIPTSERVYDYYPHQLSGGMRQRVLIAIALSCKPALLIADEPTTALDATIQIQILRLINALRKKINVALLLITHDLGIVAGVADRVYVMYAGEIVEKGSTGSIYHEPKHPYVQGLLESTMSIDTFKEELVTMKGSIPDMLNLPPACRFHPRCPHVMDVCKERKPVFKNVGNEHYASCWLCEG